MSRTSLIALLLFATRGSANAAELTIDTPMPPPAWALLERELLVANTRACEEFFARYFDERGNINQSLPRTLIVQGGAYGEHEFLDVEFAGKSVAIHDNRFCVVLAPGAGARLTIAMRRYANQPTLSPPSR